MCNIITRNFSNRKLLVDLLAMMFGIATWIGINGTYAQLPLLMMKAPESYSLAMYMVILVQLANLGPIIYTIFAKYSSRTPDTHIIYGLLGCATLAMYAMAFTYQKTYIVFGAKHSVALLGFMFIIAVVGCTSSVLFTPHMRNYREIYLISYLVGEGLSGFIPSAVALIQGIGGEEDCDFDDSRNFEFKYQNIYPQPRFSTEIFFLFLGTLLLMGLTSFIGLNKLPVARGEHVKPPGSTGTQTDITPPLNYNTNSDWAMSQQMYIYLLIMIGIIGFLGHSVLPSILPYSSKAYGNTVYHLALLLAAIACTLTMSLGFIDRIPKSVNFLSLLTGLIILLSGTILYLALKSPTPPFQKTQYGKFIVISLYIVLNGSIGFVKMGITTIFRPDPGRGLYYAGVATQVGSLVGAVITYILSENRIFKEYNVCLDKYGNSYIEWWEEMQKNTV